MLDLGGIPLHAEDRGPDDTLVIAGGPGAQNPELLAPVHRPVRHRRRRAEPAGRLRPLEVDAGRPGLEPRGQARADRRGGRLGLRPAVLRAGSTTTTARSPRSTGLRDDVPDGDQALRDRRPRRHPAADPADRPVRRDGARPDRHRDHARLPLAVPVLPEHRHQAAAALPHGRDDRQRRARELPEHRLRRDQPALALDQRLSRLRGAGHADERGLHAAGREDLAAQPADHRDAQEDPRPARTKGGAAA